MSDSNAVKLRYVPEVTYGVTPVDDSGWKELRYVSETFSASPVTVNSAEVRADRAISDMPKTNTTITGSINYELSANTYDDFIEAGLGGTWAQDGVNLWDILEQGTTYRSFSVEKEFSDITKFIAFKGQRVGSFSMDVAFGSIITGSIGFAGSDGVTGVASLVGAGSSAAANTNPIITGSSDVSSVKIDGVETSICIQSMSFNLENNLREIGCVKSDTPSDQRWGTANITGDIVMYLDADAFDLYGTALTNGEISLEYEVTDGTNSFRILLPRVKLSGDAPQSGGLDQDVQFTASYTALIDAVEGTPIRVRRTPNI